MSLAKAPPHLARDVSKSWREGGQDVLRLSSHVVRRLGTSTSQIRTLRLSYDYIEVLKLRIGGGTKSLIHELTLNPNPQTLNRFVQQPPHAPRCRVPQTPPKAPPGFLKIMESASREPPVNTDNNYRKNISVYDTHNNHKNLPKKSNYQNNTSDNNRGGLYIALNRTPNVALNPKPLNP